MDESQDRPISTNGGIDPYGLFDRSTSSVAPERAAVPQSDPSNFNYDYMTNSRARLRSFRSQVAQHINSLRI